MVGFRVGELVGLWVGALVGLWVGALVGFRVEAVEGRPERRMSPLGEIVTDSTVGAVVGD